MKGNRFISLLIAIVMVISIISIVSPDASAASGIANNGLGGIYIDIYAAPYSDGRWYECGDPYGKYGCTWFVGARVMQLTGKGSYYTQNPSSWYYSYGPSLGFNTGTTPQAPAVICYDGHVAILEKIDGDTAYISEGGVDQYKHDGSYENYASGNGYTAIHRISVSEIPTSGGHRSDFIGYLYLGTASPFTPVDMGADFYGAIESLSLNKPIKTSGAELVRGNRDGSDEQRWHFQKQGDSSYKITNVASDKCLDVYEAASTNGTKVWTCGSNNSDAQRWYFRSNGNGLSLVPKCAPKMALDLYAVGGSNIGLYEYNEGNGNQIFGVDYQPSFSPRNLGEKFYANIIFSKFGSAVGVNLSNRNVEPMGYTGDNNQLWLFERYDDRMYKITNVANGQCLDVMSAETADNTNIWTYTSNSSFAQRWYFKANGSGVSLVPKLAMNKSMDCVWNSNTNTTNCAIWSSGDGNTNQIFTIKYKLTPDITSNFNGKRYEVYNTTLAWNQAYKFCEQQGGHLVTINSQEEQAFIESLLPSCTYDRVWTGGTDVYNEGNWKWINGEEIHYSNWNDNQPDNYNNNEYVLIINKSTGKWNDINSDVWNNTYNLYSFICEYEEDINASKYSPDKTFDYNGHRYEIYSDVVDWQTAEKVCSKKGGHLVSIISSSENGVIFDNIKNLTNERYWIGASDLQLEGKWSWSNGEIINYTNWNSSEPSNSDGVEDYAEINASTGKWNDMKGFGCTYKSIGFICEYDEIKPTVYIGDVDGDGEIEIRDATFIQRVEAKIDVPYYDPLAADVDGNGDINIMDATAIQYYLANMKTQFPIGTRIE